MTPPDRIRALCFDWGGTLMSEDGPQDRPMALWPEVRVLDGVHETLAALVPFTAPDRAEDRLRLCIATNASISSRTMIELALQRGGLLAHFEQIFCFTELGLRKESPAFWCHLAESLQLAPRQIAMVGDTLEPDVLAPQASGLRAFWLRPEGRPADLPDSIRLVRRLPELLPELLPSLGPGRAPA